MTQRASDVIVIRKPAAPSDAERIVAAMRPESTQNLAFFEEPITVERERAYLERMRSSRDSVIMLVEHVDERLLGTIGLHEIDAEMRTARLGMIIFDPADRGKGYGSYAIRCMLAYGFVQFGLNKIYLNVFVENERGRRLYAGLGFKVEGTLRQEYLLRGQYHDLVRMSMLAGEWQALYGSVVTPRDIP